MGREENVDSLSLCRTIGSDRLRVRWSPTPVEPPHVFLPSSNVSITVLYWLQMDLFCHRTRFRKPRKPNLSRLRPISSILCVRTKSCSGCPPRNQNRYLRDQMRDPLPSAWLKKPPLLPLAKMECWTVRVVNTEFLCRDTPSSKCGVMP